MSINKPDRYQPIAPGPRVPVDKPNADEGLVHLIQQVLDDHASEQTWKAGGWAGDTACACGWRMAMWTRKDFPVVHRKHVAEQIMAVIASAEAAEGSSDE